MKLNKKTKKAIKRWIVTNEFLNKLIDLDSSEDCSWIKAADYLLLCASNNVLETFAKDYNQIELPHYLHKFFVGIPKQKKENIAPVERAQMFIDVCYKGTK